MYHGTGNVTVRMPIKTQKKLEQIAAEMDRSRNWLINAAIEHYIDVYDWQEKRIRERLKSAEKGGKFLSKSQANEIIDSFKP